MANRRTQKCIEATLKTLPREIKFQLSVLEKSDGSGEYLRAYKLVNEAAHALDYLSDELVKQEGGR